MGRNNNILARWFNFFPPVGGGGRAGLILLILVMSVATSMAQKPVNHIEVEQCETFEFSVVDWPGDRYTWDLYTELQWDSVNFAMQKGNVDPAAYFENAMYEGSTVTVHWLDPGKYFLRIMVWDEKKCTNNLMVYTVDVLEHIPQATITGDSLCYGDPVLFKIIITGKGKWEAIYTYGDGTASLNLYGENEVEQTVKLPPLPVGTTEIWVKQIIDECNSNVTPSEKGRVFIFPIPTNSKIYPKNK